MAKCVFRTKEAVFLLAKHEHRKYENNEQIWVGKYGNLSNLPHWHSDCEFVFIERGHALICVDGKKMFLEKGQGVFIASNQIHYINAEQNSILAFIMYDCKLTKNITDKYFLKMPILQNSNIEPIYNLIYHEIKEKKQFYLQAINQLLISFVVSVFRSEEIISGSKIQCDNDGFEQLLEDIDDKYSFYTFEKAVDFIALSPPYFSKRFHSVFGMTFSQYLNLVRVEKAVELIKNNTEKLSFTQIASLCGFDTIRNFNRVFVLATGYSPRQLPPNYDIMFIRQVNNSTGFNPTDKQSIRLE